MDMYAIYIFSGFGKYAFDTVNTIKQWDWYVSVGAMTMYIVGTQMITVLTGKDLALEGQSPKIKDKQVPGIFTEYKSHYHLPISTP